MPHLKNFYQYLEELVKQSNDIFWIRNADYSKQLFVSPAYEKIWGLPCESLYKFPGGWINSIFSEDRERLEKDFAKRNPKVLPGEKFYQSYRIIRPDGKVCWIEDESFPIFDSQEKHIGFAGIAKDVTEKMIRELSLKKATKEAKAANKAKTEFIANMSHDIRTPLNGVIGLAEVLREKAASEQDQEYGEMIYVASHRLLELLNSVLDVIKTDHVNENDVYMETFNLHELLRHLFGLMQASTNARGIELNFVIDPHLPHYVISDQLKIQRILQNLLGNAIKFTHQGHVNLNVQVRKQTDDDVKILFSILDTGIGIPKDQQPHIFERFYRAQPSYEGTYQGHGVGLYIVKKFVGILKGKIQVESEVGKGTCISFSLPVQVGKAKDAKKLNFIDKEYPENIPKNPKIIRSEEIPVKTPSIPKTPSADSLNILFVEDNDIGRKTGKILLENAGHHVLLAENAETAINLFKSQRFDLIITDLGLPGIQGNEMVSLLRYWEKISLKKPVPIAALTAHANSEIKDHCLLAGIDRVYSKPLDESSLANIINWVKKNKKNSGLEKQDSVSQPEELGADLPNTETGLFALEQYPLLDEGDGLGKSGNKKNLQAALAMMLEEMLPAEMVDLKEAHLAGDWEKAQKIAHKLKGGSLYCGTIRMTMACQYFERYWKMGYRKLLEELYQQLVSVIEETKTSISLYLKNMLA